MDDVRGYEQELDAHLMNTTLKEFHHMSGTKFPIFGDVQFQRECLEAHNRIRTSHGCPALSWCQELGDQAQQWAERLAVRGIKLYSELPGIGENIAFYKIQDLGSLPSAEDICEGWANEAKTYDYNKPGWATAAKNYSQLVWRATREMGVGRALIPDTMNIVVVAFYRPAGNTNYSALAHEVMMKLF